MDDWAKSGCMQFVCFLISPFVPLPVSVKRTKPLTSLSSLRRKAVIKGVNIQFVSTQHGVQRSSCV